MEQRELEIATDLLEETTSWLSSDKLLAGLRDEVAELVYLHNWMKIPVKVVVANIWNAMTDPSKEDTVVHILDKELEEAQSIFFYVDNSSPEPMSALISGKNELVNQIALESQNVKKLGARMDDYRRKGADRPLLGIQNSVNAHFAAINEMRFVTLSRRIALTEALFFAYKQGLLPFGWDHESLWCLNPANLGSTESSG
jgi:hypothetical protein